MNSKLRSRLPIQRSQALVAAGALVAGLCMATAANAGLVIVSEVGGAPTGAIHENFDSLAPDTAPISKLLPSGITISFATDAKVAVNSVGGTQAAPYLSGGNGLGFGSPNQADGPNATPYITSGSTGTYAGAGVTLLFPDVEMYMGLLWGSVDDYNTLTFYNGNEVIGTILGSQVKTADGDCIGGVQTAKGTCYVNINVDGGKGFDRVVATSSQYAFEFDNVAFSTSTINVPEPGALGMMGLGLLALGGLTMRRRKFSVE